MSRPLVTSSMDFVSWVAKVAQLLEASGLINPGTVEITHAGALVCCSDGDDAGFFAQRRARLQSRIEPVHHYEILWFEEGRITYEFLLCFEDTRRAWLEEVAKCEALPVRPLRMVPPEEGEA